MEYRYYLFALKSEKLMTTNKREAIKAQRTRKKRQRRMNTLIGAGLLIIIVIIVLISPTIYKQLKPAGNFIHITPVARPLVNGNSIGDPNARVKVLVFEDYQCPYCKDYTQQVEPQLDASTYITSGQVYYKFIQFPFLDENSATKESHQASNASMCALEQGRFWDYHDMLFANQGAENSGSFNNKRLQAFADALGLDMTKFNQCFSQNKYSAQIETDYQESISMGVTRTPTVLVNGKNIAPGVFPSWDILKAAINAALASGG